MPAKNSASDKSVTEDENNVPTQRGTDNITVLDGTGADGQEKRSIVISDEEETGPGLRVNFFIPAKHFKILGAVAVAATAAVVAFAKKQQASDSETIDETPEV